MAERSFVAEIGDLRKGEGDVFSGLFTVSSDCFAV